MKLKLLILVIFTFALPLVLTSCIGVKIETEQGDLSFLKDQKLLNLEYDYSSMIIGDYSNVQEYYDQKIAGYNRKKPGKGDKWLENWITYRSTKYEPKFEEFLNKVFKEKSVIASKRLEEAKYTLILRTLSTEPGYNFHISARKGSIDCEAIFVETKNKSNVLARIFVRDCNGDIYGSENFDFGSRIKDAYAKCARILGNHIIEYF